MIMSGAEVTIGVFVVTGILAVFLFIMKLCD